MSQKDGAASGAQPLEEAAERPRSAAVERYLAAREARRFGPTARLDDAPRADADTLWRGLLRDGQMRLIVARVGHASAEIAARLGCDETASAFVAELVCAAQLLRATLNPDETLQIAGFQSAGVGNFVVDVFDDGRVRATLRQPTLSGDPLAGGTLQVTRQQKGRGQYRSSIAFDAGESPSQLLMRYLLESEQILSLLEVDLALPATAGARSDGRHVAGFLVQLMPEGTREDLAQLVANIERCDRLAASMVAADPDGVAWAETLLRGFHWDQVARQSVAFGCQCSAERVVALLSTLSRADLHELVAGLEVIESTCDYCRTTWTTPVAQLAPLLANPS